MTTPSIAVIGSMNIDLVCRTPRLPRGGETILGKNLITIPGGKGANQAVAAARLGGEVHFVGRIGDDHFGRLLLRGLSDNGVHTHHLTPTPNVPSGTALIILDDNGMNLIVVSPGANARLTPADVSAAEPILRRAAVVLLQLEIPLATVRHAIAMCRRLGVPTILDPAPVPPRGLPRALYRVNVLTPNEPEARQLAGSSKHAPARLAQTLLANGPDRVVLKLGASGSLWHHRAGTLLRANAFPVKAIDTTAAGDAFTAALAVALAEGRQPREALRFANAAGALCCTKLGAQPALPTRPAVERLLASQRDI